MKKYFIAGFFFVVLIAVVCMGFLCKQTDFKKDAAIKKSTKNDGVFTVLELFTSEGCSSCPAADVLMAKILAEKDTNVFVLAYHVDYWNRLGWQDRFSKPEWSARQQQYVKYLSTDGAYTPQLVVNGKYEFVGSDETKLRNSLAKKTVESEAQLSVSIRKVDAKTISINYDAVVQRKSLLNIALVQPDAATQVKGGENKGRQLHHVNIVSLLKTIEIVDRKGVLNVNLPDELLNVPINMIAFIQSKNNFEISAIKQTAL